MEVSITFENGYKEHFEEVENFLGASKNYPYWLLWLPIDEAGKQEMYMWPDREVRRVKLYGAPEGAEDDKPQLKVVKLREGGDENWDNIEE